MSEWRGLHNLDFHVELNSYSIHCDYCACPCRRNLMCRCCGQAEVERLTGELADRETCRGSTDCSSSRPAEGSEVIQSPSDPSFEADDGQRLDIDDLLSQRMEQVHRAEAAEAEVERLTADYNAAVERIHELLAEKADRDRKIDLALDIPIRLYAEGTVNSEEAAWHRGWNDAVTALHDASNPEFVDEDEGESDE